MIDIQVEYHSGIPVYKQIITAITDAVARGQLDDGDKLPSIRELSDHLSINPNTTAKVYRELELRGLIESRPGSGCFVLPRETPAISEAEKQHYLKELWEQMMNAAGKYQINETEVVEFLRRRIRP